MNSSKITSIINETLKNDGLHMTLHSATICRYLKKEYGRPRKIKKVFYLNEKQKKQRMQFCQDILKKGITGDQMFFIDETKIEMGPYINDSIRLTKESKEKLKKGQKEAFDLVNRPQRKFELSIMVGGIYSKGLRNLILLEGPENEFS